MTGEAEGFSYPRITEPDSRGQGIGYEIIGVAQRGFFGIDSAKWWMCGCR